MKIVEVSCKQCQAEFEILESFPKELLACPACQSKELDQKITDREFSGCGGGCSDCSSCK